MQLKRFWNFFVLFAVAFALTGEVYGQAGATGTFVGTVSDPSGAVVSGATVDITNASTGLTSHTVTSASGDYTVPYLLPGLYQISVQSPGFQKSVVSNTQLVVAQIARVNVKLNPGAVSQTVTVAGSAVKLDTDTAAISQIVTQRQVEDLPLNGRNFTQLMFIGTGAVTVSGEAGSMRAGEGNAISLNGSRPESNNYLLDGLPNTDEALNTPAVVLSVDAIQEFKEQTSTYSAQYGFSANQVNISSKSGTNNLHGSLFWFNRNNAYDAQNYFYEPGTPIPILKQNQFGFVAAGPVYLPKVYDGHDKTFWMANYEGWRITQGQTTFQNVLTPAELSGNFSALAGNPACVVGSVTAGCRPIDPTTGQPFPGNQIPPSRFSRLANEMLSAGYFPTPNCGAAGCNGFNYTETPTNPTSMNQQTYRIDQNLGRYGNIFGRGSIDTYKVTSLGSVSIPAGNVNFYEQATSWEVDHTISFGPTKVNNFLVGYLEAVANQGTAPTPPAQIAQLGLTGTFTQLNSSFGTPPGIGFGNNLGENITNFGGAGNAYTTSDQPMWDATDGFTWIKGNHVISIGGEYRRWLFNRNLASNPLGNFNFSDYFSGNQVADFLLGYYSNAATFQPSGLSAPNGNPRQFNFNYFAPYVQDDWKTTSRLTLNLGLRWDYRPFPYETHNHMGWLDTTNPNGGLCVADPNLVKAGVTAPAPGFKQFYRYCGKRTPRGPEMTNFGPRVGFAFRPFGGDATVVRGGYGMYWDSVEGREIDGSADIYPYVIRTSLSQTPGALLPGVPTTNQLFVDYSHSVGPVVPGATGEDTFLAVNISENPKNPYVQDYTISVERLLARNTTLEVNYIGNKGTHLLARQEINQANDPSAFCIANPTVASCSPVARYPYPYFATFIDSMWGVSSNYNSGTIKLERRTPSMAITSLFTWAKSFDDKSAPAGIGNTGTGYQGFMDNHDPALDYGPSDFDVDHRFVASFVDDLPIGRGKRIAGNVGRAANAAIGGWEINGIITAQTGFPFTVGATDIDGLLNTVAQRANLVGNATGGFTRSRNEWFNTKAFTQPSVGHYGTSTRNYLRQPGIADFDLSAIKDTTLPRNVLLQLRLETFNTFNHPQFSNDGSVDSNVNDSTYGRILSADPGRIVQLGAKILF